MTIVKKIIFLLNKKDKFRALKLFILMMIGMLLEIAGVSLIIPVLALLNNSDLAANNIYLSSFLSLVDSVDFLPPIMVVMILFGFFYFFKAIYLIYLSYEQSKFVFSLQAKLSNRLYLGYLNNSYSFHLQKNSAELQRNVDETADVASAVSACAIFISESLVLIGIVVLLFVIEPAGTLIVILSFTFTSYFVYFLTKNKLQNYGLQRHLNESHRLRHLKHGLNGIKVIKAFEYEEFFSNKFTFYVHNIAQINKMQTVIKGLPKILLEVITVLSLVILVSVLTIQGEATSNIITIVAVFGAAAFRLTPSFNKIIGSAQALKYVNPVIDTLYEEFFNLNHSSSLKNIDKDSFFNGSFSKIEIKNISLNYPGSETVIFKDLNLVINHGDMIGVTGESGAGKSSLVDSIMGLIQVKGSILVDNVNIKDDLSNWKKNIGYVPQDIFLIDDTIRANIAFGIKDHLINEDNLSSAIKKSSLTKLIKESPLGYETIVGENGVRLSGGQRQRIGIARALYHDPELLIFDEATSALDEDTENKIMDTITKIANDKTILIVTHRPNSLKNCNKVFTMVNGNLHLNNLN